MFMFTCTNLHFITYYFNGVSEESCLIYYILHTYLLPLGYIPIRTPARKLTATPTPLGGATPHGFFIQQEDRQASQTLVDAQPKGNLPFMKPEDAQYFDKLLVRIIIDYYK